MDILSWLAVNFDRPILDWIIANLRNPVFDVLMPFITPALVSLIMAAVAGIMIYIAFDELLPATHYYGENHIALYGLFLGMAIMAASLVIL
jgi:zinc transporter ZupT